MLLFLAKIDPKDSIVTMCFSPDDKQLAVEVFGSDKPDLRIPLVLQDVEDLVRDEGFAVFAGPASKPGHRVVVMRVPGGCI